jgi:hypothetical protein
MHMTHLLKVLAANHDKGVVPGYNYAVFSIGLPASEVGRTVALLRRKKPHVEREYRKATGKRLALLPYVCLARSRSVLVPVPSGCSLNMLSGIVLGLPGMYEKVKVPVWS